MNNKLTEQQVLDGVPESVARRTRREFPAGAVLMHEGDPSDCVHYLLSGRVRVERRSGNGRQVTVAELDAGEVVGEMGVITGQPRNATVVAIEDTRTLELRPRRSASWKPLPVSMELGPVLIKIMRRRLADAAFDHEESAG